MYEHFILVLDTLHTTDEYTTTKVTTQHFLSHPSEAFLSIAIHFVDQNDPLKGSVVDWEVTIEKPALIHHYFISHRNSCLCDLKADHWRYRRMTTENQLSVFLQNDDRKRSYGVPNGDDIGSIEVSSIARRKRHTGR